MAGKGPMPTPTAILERRGSKLAKSRRGEPQFDRGRPSCPSWLTREGKAEWNRVVKQLDNAGVMTEADRAALAAFCDAWSDYVIAAAAVKEAGKLTEAIRRGLVKAKTAARDALLKASDRFGLNPAARSRVKASDDQNEEPAGLAAFRVG